MYEPRQYRERMGKGRFSSFGLVDKETDLWIGVSPNLPSSNEIELLKDYIRDLRNVIEKYISIYPDFLLSHSPLEIFPNDTGIVREMKRAGMITSTGPMASVAGAFAWYAGKYLEKLIPCREFIIENGGDIFMKIEEEIVLSPFVRGSDIFRQLAMKITPGEEYLSVCSSSGTFGHSFSYGSADLVTVISADPLLADAWATSLANRVNDKEDVEKVTAVLPENILGVIAVKEDKLAYKGPYLFVSV